MLRVYISGRAIWRVLAGSGGSERSQPSKHTIRHQWCGRSKLCRTPEAEYVHASTHLITFILGRRFHQQLRFPGTPSWHCTGECTSADRVGDGKWPRQAIPPAIHAACICVSLHCVRYNSAQELSQAADVIRTSALAPYGFNIDHYHSKVGTGLQFATVPRRHGFGRSAGCGPRVAPKRFKPQTSEHVRAYMIYASIVPYSTADTLKVL